MSRRHARAAATARRAGTRIFPSPRRRARRGASDAALDKTTDTVETADDRRIAAEEDRRVLRLERLEAAIGRAAGLVPRRPREAARVESCAVETAAQQVEPRLAEGDLRGLAEDLDLEGTAATLAYEFA